MMSVHILSGAERQASYLSRLWNCFVRKAISASFDVNIDGHEYICSAHDLTSTILPRTPPRMKLCVR
jgi:hypothetical protein